MTSTHAWYTSLYRFYHPKIAGLILCETIWRRTNGFYILLWTLTPEKKASIFLFGSDQHYFSTLDSKLKKQKNRYIYNNQQVNQQEYSFPEVFDKFLLCAWKRACKTWIYASPSKNCKKCKKLNIKSSCWSLQWKTCWGIVLFRNTIYWSRWFTQTFQTPSPSITSQFLELPQVEMIPTFQEKLDKYKSKDEF